MNYKKDVTKFFSGPLMKQNIKSSWMLCIAIILVMILMSTVMNYAGSIMQNETSGKDVSKYQEEFFTYLGALASYDELTQGDLSYKDFTTSKDRGTYDTAFAMINSQAKTNLSCNGFEKAANGLKQSGVSIDTYVKEFEYNYALGKSKGVFDGKKLTMSGMLDTTLEIMGVDPETIEKISETDTSAMITRMYYTVAGLLPIFILIVILTNSLIAAQVDRGSMAYVLSTPTKRSAVALTQIVFMIFVPLIVLAIVGSTRLGTTYLFYDKVNPKGIIALYVGMYLLVEAVSGICYLGSCIFSQSRKALGFGGGLTMWFFIASLIGMFGTESMVSTGMGVEELNVFNKLTVIGLYDIDTISTVGTANVDYGFVWKLVLLLVIAVACYIAGSVRFVKKDLPL